MSQFIKLYGFSTGRRVVALRKVRKVAMSLGAHAIVAHIDVALAHDSKTRELDLEWLGYRDRLLSRSGLRPIDELVDTSLTGIRDGALSLTKGARDCDAIADKARYLLAEIFPAGVAAVSTLPCVDELAAVEVIASKLQGDLAPLVSELGLTLQVQRLIDLIPEYQRVIDEGPNAVEFRKVREAREQGQTYLQEVMALILGTYYNSKSPVHMANRAALVEPIMEQQEAIRAYRQARRPVLDLDPETELLDTRPYIEENPATP